MGLFSKDIKNLEDLYQHGLKDIYYAENQIVKSLPDMIENATNAELKRGLQHHLRETKEQVKRLEQVFALHGEQPSGTKCPAIDGIIKEGGDLMGEVEDKAVLNVGISWRISVIVGPPADLRGEQRRNQAPGFSFAPARSRPRARPCAAPSRRACVRPCGRPPAPRPCLCSRADRTRR